MGAHPLDRPVWSALTTRQAGLALGDGQALRFDPAYALFAAAADDSPESQAALARLTPPGAAVWLVETEEKPAPSGCAATYASCHQMIAEALTPGEIGFDVVALTDADGPEMLALARLTNPGPFFERTHRLGAFIGVKHDGRLVAMAGERMRPTGFVEVSGVCTHPDHRGRGYARGLMRLVAAKILERSETPFLHVYASNAGAIALYESLGFRLRRPIVATVLARA